MTDPPLPDLRALTRDNVRAQIGETAWTVFAERGFDEVTADEVARAAGISRASFFRYFNCKEEAVFVAVEAHGAGVAAELARRPASEDAWTALRNSIEAGLGSYSTAPERSLARLRLIHQTPALRAHQLEMQAAWQRLIVPVLAIRTGVEAGDVRVEALVAAAIGALDVALARWAEEEGAIELRTLIGEAFAAIAEPPPRLLDAG